MTMLLGTRRSLFGGREAPYYEKVLGYGPIAYWPLWETAGAAAECLVNPLQSGTAVGVTWNNAVGPDGVNGAPFFDGANDYISIFTATFDAAFNGATGTMMIWQRVFNAGVWTDLQQRRALKIFDDATNYYVVGRSNVNNTYLYEGQAGGGGAAPPIVITPTTWFCTHITWSDGANADELKVFYGGIQQGATSAALNNWNGLGLDAVRTLIGANTTGPVQVWHGWLAHAAVWDTVLMPAQILDLATV